MLWARGTWKGTEEEFLRMPLGLWNGARVFTRHVFETCATWISSDFSHLLMKNNLSLNLDHRQTGLAPSKVMKPISSKIKFEPQTPLHYIIARDLFLLIMRHSLPSTVPSSPITGMVIFLIIWNHQIWLVIYFTEPRALFRIGKCSYLPLFFISFEMGSH